MDILVTGHCGFVGSHLVPRLLDLGHNVIGADIAKSALPKRIDICDGVLPGDREVDRVFHLAAQTDAQCTDSEVDARTNIFGTIRIMKRYGHKVVFASSSMVKYPTSPYAISKLAAEQYVGYYGGAVVRFCNLYGPGGHSVIDKFAAEDPIRVFGSGEQRRTYQDVTVAVNMLLAVHPGDHVTLLGMVKSVNELAAETGKKIVKLPARKNDLLNAT